MTFVPMLFWLLVAHALTDYVWQPERMVITKGTFGNSAGCRAEYGPWWWWMGAHGMINAGGVAMVTGSVGLGLAEGLVHIAADTAKCTKRLTANQDQVIHLLSKLLWAGLVCS